MLEHAVAVAEGADLRAERDAAAGDEVDRVERLEALLQLDAVGADVLHPWARPGCPSNLGCVPVGRLANSPTKPER